MSYFWRSLAMAAIKDPGRLQAVIGQAVMNANYPSSRTVPSSPDALDLAPPASGGFSSMLELGRRTARP